jgi:hypothetical protein
VRATFLRPVTPTNNPTVTVVVPCYNYGHYLPALVAGLQAQTGVTLDIIIVDDASPDGSGLVAETLATTRPGVQVIRHTKNAGHIQTYNDGLERAGGKYVVLLSADDYLPPGALGRAVALMEAKPDVGLVYGFSQSFSGDVPSVHGDVRNWSVWDGLDWLRTSSRRGRCFIASPEVVMRTQALRETSGYDTRLPHSADFALWMQTSLHWQIGRVNGPPQALYRVHDSNMHLTTYAGMLTDLRERRRTFGILFTEHAANRPEVAMLEVLAMRAMAKQSARLALAGHRDGIPASEIQSYLDFAEETWPQISRSPVWTACKFGPIAGHQVPLRSGRRLGAKAWNHAVWRRWRRYGV